MTKDDSHSLRNGIIATVIGGPILSPIGYVVFFYQAYSAGFLNSLRELGITLRRALQFPDGCFGY